MDDSGEMTLGCVTLAHFAFVRAGLTDGLGLEELLGFLRLDAPIWQAAEEAWDEHVLDAIDILNHDLGGSVVILEACYSGRYLGPRTGDPVTMDFAPKRLNFEYDRSGKLIRVTCG